MAVALLAYPRRVEEAPMASGSTLIESMNATLVKKALEKVGDPHVLVNMVSQRVRQLNSGGGRVSQPLVPNVEHLGEADIALTEIGTGALGWEMPDFVAPTRPTGRGRKRPQHWAKFI